MYYGKHTNFRGFHVTAIFPDDEAVVTVQVLEIGEDVGYEDPQPECDFCTSPEPAAYALPWYNVLGDGAVEMFYCQECARNVADIPFGLRSPTPELWCPPASA